MRRVRGRMRDFEVGPRCLLHEKPVLINALVLTNQSSLECMVRRLTAREKRRIDRQVCANVFGLCVESGDSWPC